MMTVEPRTLSKYELRSVLGRGATGTVYEAWDPAIARKVAIKTVDLPPAGEAQDELARFKREAQAAGRLSHPNIVAAYDYGETASLAYIVMEYVDGRTLKSVLDANERLALSDTLRVMRDVLIALDYSHEHGVIHRDIKPANVILTADGHAKVADFGIARIESSSLTQAGTVMGTPAYMSPEQFMGQVVDRRTDIYACGVLLYQLLTGERPFEGGLTAIMHKVLNQVPPPPSALSVTVSAALDAIVMRAMARRPEDRYGSAAELAQALGGVTSRSSATAGPGDAVDEATLIAMPANLSTLPNRPLRARVPVLALAIVGVLAAGLGGAAWLLYTPGKPAQEQAASRPPVLIDSGGPSIAVPPPIPPQPALAPDGQSAELNTSPPLESGTPPSIDRPIEPLPVEPAFPKPIPADPAAALRKAVAAALDRVPCALIGGDLMTPQELRLTGLARKGAESEIRAAVTQAAPGTRIAWAAAPVDDVYCPALNALRPVAGRFGAPSGLEAHTADGRTRYLDGEAVVVSVAMPPYPAWLRVDSLSNDGEVTHVHPEARVTAAERFDAGARAMVGEPAEGFVPLTIGPPYGMAMLVLIASDAPLFTEPRPVNEPTGVYLHALEDAIGAARRSGAAVAATVLALLTAPRPASGDAGRPFAPRR
jgi:serine/threonine-protein kinase